VAVTVAVTVVVTVVGIVDVRTMGIVDLLGAHHIEGVVIILPDTHHPMVEEQEGTGPGRFLILLARKGNMLVVLGDAFRFWHPLWRGDFEFCETVMVL
jgi:hypothetical protein